MKTKGQHFLLSAAARTLSLAKVMRMTDDQAFDAFRSIRWADTDGDAVCADVGHLSLSCRVGLKCANSDLGCLRGGSVDIGQ